MLKTAYIKFTRDYSYLGEREKGTVLEVTASEEQFDAWKEAGVADLATETEIKVAEAAQAKVEAARAKEEGK